MDRRNNTDVIIETIAPEGKRVIDVGCGDGGLVRALTRHGARVLGIECSPRQLAKAQASAKIGDEEIIEGVGQSLALADSSADVVVFFNSLHHIPHDVMGAALAEAARVLKSGGLVYICEPLPEGAFFDAVRPIDDETEMRAAALAAIQACSAAGLMAEAEIRYIHTIRMFSYEMFRDRIISANSEREERFDRMDADMRPRFERLAICDNDGAFCFDQPMRVNLLRKQ
jgi:SAM-dependent methyltransferase